MSGGWDETLYAGIARYYVVGRMPYPDAIPQTLRGKLGLNGTQRLLDVGCGPGSLTLVLAPLVGTAIGIDADREMLDEAQRAAEDVGLKNVMWRHMRAEELPADLAPVDLVTFAQSFHWMDRADVASTVRGMLTSNGVCVHVQAATHRGDSSEDPLPLPRPPWEEVKKLVATYLRPGRGFGGGRLARGTPSEEEEILRGAGFHGPERIDVPNGEIVTRTADEVVAAVFSLPPATPQLFRGRRESFERDLRNLLVDASPDGEFAERTRDIALNIWRLSS